MFQLGSALGIEVRENCLVFATVTKGFQGFTLKNYGVLRNHLQFSPLELRRWVENYSHGNGLSSKNVIVGLPRNQLVVRQVELPLEVEENLDQVVRLQVGRFEPLEERQSYFDYLVTGRDEKKGKIRLQIAMVSQTYLEEQLNLFQQMELYPSAICVSSTGLQKVLLVHQDGFPQKTPAIVVKINSPNVEFVAVVGKENFLSEVVSLEDDELTFERLIDELGKFLSQLNLPVREFCKVYLSGIHGPKFLPDFRQKWSECELLWERLTLKRQNGPELPVLVEAIGLAVSGINRSQTVQLNLMPEERRKISEGFSIIPTLFLTGLLVIMGSAVIVRDYFQQQTFLEKIQNEIERTRPEVESAVVLRDKIDEKQNELKELQKLVKESQKVLLILRELTEIMPENSFLQSLNIQGQRLSLTGYSSSASRLLKVLLSSRFLDAVESRYIIPDRTKKGREKFSFEASFKEE